MGKFGRSGRENTGGGAASYVGDKQNSRSKIKNVGCRSLEKSTIPSGEKDTRSCVSGGRVLAKKTTLRENFRGNSIQKERVQRERSGKKLR